MWFKHKILKKISLLLAAVIICAALLFSIFRSLTPWAVQYKDQIEQHLSKVLNQPTQIKSMQTGWYWFQPVLQLNQVTINPDEKKPLRIGKLLIGINLFKSLWHGRIEPGLLYVDSLHVVLREEKGRWRMDGISSLSVNEQGVNTEQLQKTLSWLTDQGSIIVKNLSVIMHTEQGTLIPIRGINASIINKGRAAYKLKGEARLDQAKPSLFQIMGDIRFDPYRLNETKGQVYLSAKQIAPAEWQGLFPQLVAPFAGGRGDISLWLDLNQGTISSAQAQITLQELAWHFPNKKNQLIDSLNANVSWKPQDSGWQFQADKVSLSMNGVNWPINQIALSKNTNQQSYQLFVKTILIEPLLAMDINWPVSLKALIKLNPQGVLQDNQLLVKEGQPQYILTRFENLGWEAPQFKTKVRNLSGVLHWQPEEGRLELDSENTTLKFKDYPLQTFTLLNGAFDWKELSEGLRLSIDKLVLNQAELTLSLEGILDQLKPDSIGRMQLKADFSGKNLQQWIPYIPEKILKPKLELWLKNDVKRIGNATGQIRVDGLAKEFPFDNSPGVFTITSHISDVDLFISSKWQLIKDLEGYLRVDHRNLDVDLVNGDFQGVPIKQLNLRIADIGKDKEVMLIYGIIHGAAQKIQNFVMASPLKQKLSALKNISFKGFLDLNLKLDIPLYNEDLKVAAKGELQFKNNTLVYHHQVGELDLENVLGSLTFDEKGIIQSELTSNLFGYPFHIHIQSTQDPLPATNISAEGDITIESLKNQLQKSPVFSLLKGMFHVNALLKLTNNTKDFDNLTLKSTLEGMAIDLPEPIGKTHETKMPLEVSLDFNLNQGIRLKADYNSRVSADLLFKEHKGMYAFQSGQLRLGSADAVDQQKSGLAIVGNLEAFDLEKWSAVGKQLSLESSPSDLLKHLRIINVTLGQFTFLKQQFDKMAVLAKIGANNSWNLNVKQKNIQGDIVYQPGTKSVSGHLQYLHLNPLKSEESWSSSLSKSSPDQIPPLNLRIDTLEFGTINLGTVVLKSHSSKDRWHIDYCSIESPEYQFLVEGFWTQKGKVNQTTIDLKLQLKNLAKSLERWDIIPAVHAGTGEMQFKGGWNRSIFDFSLASLKGTMYLKLKNGIITHLSPETEEKLGLGKLLSILSLQTIPRRLKLDFSDLSHQGYSFDIFQGNFTIDKGIMSTNDGYLDGPVAYASMKGSLDLVKRLYDLDLQISPHITASLPVVATIAGGPIAGVATWIASKIINQSMQKISAYSYKISGPWSQPVVQQLKIVRRK